MKRRGDRGYALLFVFVLAAAVAIGLYMEMPRVAFESQRQREQLLISRGNQYKRAIQLFYRKYHTYPQNLDDLETTRNIRFLRRRYVDPMTGKADWRLIHVGPGGVLTDSLVTPLNGPNGPNGQNGANAQNGAQGSGFGQSSAFGQSANTSQPSGDSSGTDPNDPNAQGNQALNMALRRPSDRLTTAGNPGPGDQPPPNPDDPNQTNPPQNPGQPGQPQYPGQPAGQPGQPGDPSQTGQPQNPGQPVYPGQVPGQPGQTGQPQYPGQQQYPGQPGQPVYPNPAMPGYQPNQPGQPYNPNSPNQGFNTGTGQSGQAGSAFGNTGAQSNAATGLINNLLTTPRQAPSGLTGGGSGLAGVASTASGVGIHLMNDRKKYKEWEFVYDITKDKTTGVGQLMQQQQQMMQQQGQPGLNGPGGGPLGGQQPGQGFGASPQPTQPQQPTQQQQQQQPNQ